jgi:hypothetical protein
MLELKMRGAKPPLPPYVHSVLPKHTPYIPRKQAINISLIKSRFEKGDNTKIRLPKQLGAETK